MLNPASFVRDAIYSAGSTALVVVASVLVPFSCIFIALLHGLEEHEGSTRSGRLHDPSSAGDSFGFANGGIEPLGRVSVGDVADTESTLSWSEDCPLHLNMNQDSGWSTTD